MLVFPFGSIKILLMNREHMLNELRIDLPSKQSANYFDIVNWF